MLIHTNKEEWSQSFIMFAVQSCKVFLSASELSRCLDMIDWGRFPARCLSRLRYVLLSQTFRWHMYFSCTVIEERLARTSAPDTGRLNTFHPHILQTTGKFRRRRSFLPFESRIFQLGRVDWTPCNLCRAQFRCSHPRYSMGCWPWFRAALCCAVF